MPRASQGPATVTEAYALLGTDGYCLVDVRSPEEVRAKGVSGARNIPLENLATEARSLAGYTTIHVLCRSGGRSAMGTNLLHELGLTQAQNVSGGILAWEAAGLPII